MRAVEGSLGHSPKRAVERGDPAILLARRAPTIKRWSLDARSEGRFACSLMEKVKNQNVLVRHSHSTARAKSSQGRSGSHPECDGVDVRWRVFYAMLASHECGAEMGEGAKSRNDPISFSRSPNVAFPQRAFGTSTV